MARALWPRLLRVARLSFSHTQEVQHPHGTVALEHDGIRGTACGQKMREQDARVDMRSAGGQAMHAAVHPSGPFRHGLVTGPMGRMAQRSVQALKRAQPDFN